MERRFKKTNFYGQSLYNEEHGKHEEKIVCKRYGFRIFKDIGWQDLLRLRSA
jgi:hypothetical protein